MISSLPRVIGGSSTVLSTRVVGAVRRSMLAKIRIVQRSIHSTMSANTEKSLEDYKYEPLDSSEPTRIRLVSIEPGVDPDEIHCSITVVPLNGQTAFEALSYVWGDNLKSKHVYVSGRTLPVTANLYIALRRFRDPVHARQMWIDAICIDQDNIPERNQQVQIMTSIYHNAQEVIVWLGEEEESDAHAIGMIERFSTLSASLSEKEDGTPKTFGELIKPLAPAGAPEWSALAKYLQRPWFSRVWTIQEVSRSRKSRVVCGSRVIDWEALLSITEYIKEKRLTPYLETTSFVTGLLSVPFIQRYRQIVGSVNNPGLILLDLLLRTMASFATDPRDRVFALMGIINTNFSGLSGQDPQIKSPYSSIMVDYSLTCEQVYTAVAKYMLLEAKDMCMLSCTGARKYGSTLDLPSWVPDWNFLDWEYTTPSLAFTPHFIFAGDSKANVSVTDDDRILRVEGCLVDKIVRLGTKTRTILGPGDHAMSPETQLRDFRQRRALVEECDDIIRGGNADAPLPPNYWRLLVCDTTPSLTKAPPEYEDGYELFRYSLENFEALYDGSETDVARITLQVISHALCQQYVLSHQQWTRGRFLCVTEAGVLGWVPRGTQIDDMICLLKGSTVPFVLRPVGEEWKLVGEAYLHSVMQGQLYDAEDIEWLEFRIS